MSTPKAIQIFRAGRHVASNGAALNFSESDLLASARAYDPAKGEAPLVVGHPKADAPAYGWVKSLGVAGGTLAAQPDQVDPAFAEMVAAGRFKKISASFYAPNSPGNPVPGVYYLRHVGFLGAQPPAVKGLRNPEFAASEEGVVEFADYGDTLNASLWRRLRDYLISTTGLDKADSVIPDYAVAALEQDAQQDPSDDSPDADAVGAAASPSYAEPGLSGSSTAKGDEMSAEEKARLAELEAENARLKTEATDRAAREAATARAGRHTAHASFCESLVTAGKLLPVHAPVAVATMDFMAAQTDIVEFGEGEAKKPLIDAFKEFLSGQPKVVDFQERAGGKTPEDDNQDAPALAARAVEFQEAEAKVGRTFNIAQAVAHVKAQADK